MGEGGTMMLSQAAMEEILGTALSTGGDYAEVFIEETDRNTIQLSGGGSPSVLSGKDYGASIRILRGVASIHAHTNEVSREALVRLAKRAAASIGDISQNVPVSLEE